MKPKWLQEIEKYDKEQAKKDRQWKAKHVLFSELGIKQEGVENPSE